MLGRDGVARGHSLVQARHYDHAAVRERRARRYRRGQVAELAGELRLHAIRQTGIEAHEHRDGVGIVLRLRQQVGGDRGGVCRVVREHGQLGRASAHVDRDDSGDELLRGGHVTVLRPHDQVARRDRTRTIGERSDRVCAAGGKHAVRACDCGGGER